MIQMLQDFMQSHYLSQNLVLLFFFLAEIEILGKLLEHRESAMKSET